MEVQEVVSDPKVMFGKPVIAGTRLTVEHIIEELANGSTTQDLLDAYPTLTAQGIQAALSFAVRVLRNDVVLPAERARH